MSKETNPNFFETMVNAQNNMLNSFVENTKKFTNGSNPAIDEVVNKTKDAYNDMLAKQKQIFDSMNEKVKDVAENTTERTEKMNNFYKDFYQNQLAFTQNLMKSNDLLKNPMAAFTNGSNPMAAFTNGTNPMAAFTNPMTAFTNGNNPMAAFTNPMNAFTNGNSANMMSQFQKEFENLNKFSTQFMNNIKGFMKDDSNLFKSSTGYDSWKGMMNSTDTMAKFYELWSPMLSAMQNKTFNMDMYRKMFNQEEYAKFTEQFLGLVPKETRTQFDNMAKMFSEGMKNFSLNGFDMFNTMKNGSADSMPFGNHSYASMLDFYTQWYNSLENVTAPLVKLAQPNTMVNDAKSWQTITHMLLEYNLKNTDLQNMMTQTSVKSMDKFAEKMMNKMLNNEDVTSMQSLYTEWLNFSDAAFVDLFNSDGYSMLMTEVSSLQLKVKQKIDHQVESQFLKNLPIATQSEMDEMYKIVYDLKKELRELKKTVNANATATDSKLAETTATVNAATEKVEKAVKAAATVATPTATKIATATPSATATKTTTTKKSK